MKLLATVTLSILLLFSTFSFAAEQNCTLAIENMSCASCPYIIKQTLSNIIGVLDVQVSFADKTAIVIYDDTQTNVATLTDATTNVGYPSTLVE